jgi:imidazolonepropionase-like amidohydrolase
MSKYCFYLTLLFLLFVARVDAQDEVVYIKAGKLYDSQQNTLLEKKAIEVQGNKVVAIVDYSSIPPNHKIIDLSDYTVLPGLIDAHTHVLFSQEASDDFAEHSVHTIMMQSDATRVLRGSKRARSYLYEGFTSIKDLGNSGLFLDADLRNAINEGTIIGPRIFTAGQILAASGGQIYGVPAHNQSIIDQEYRIVSDVEDAKNAVREHVNQRVDLIKICADNIPNNTSLTIPEMTAIVQMAHSCDLTVTAHSITNESAWNAAMAGVDGIEHGFNLADSTLALMAEKNIFLVPTENSESYMLKYSELAGYDLNEIDWIESYLSKMNERLNRAIELGIPIVAGSDNYTKIDGITRGQSSKDMLRVYFESGMKPLEILQSATFISAYHLKKDKVIGSIAPNSFADIIAVKGDLENDFLETMDNVVFVMKDGIVYLDGEGIVIPE